MSTDLMQPDQISVPGLSPAPRDAQASAKGWTYGGMLTSLSFDVRGAAQLSTIDAIVEFAKRCHMERLLLSVPGR